MQNGYLFLSIVASDQFENDLSNPRLLYLSYALYSYDNDEYLRQSSLIKPTDFILSKDIEKKFDIDQSYAIINGEYSYTALSNLEKVVRDASIIIGFNLHSDIQIIQNEYQLNGLASTILFKPRVNLSDDKVLIYCSPAHSLQSIHDYLFGAGQNLNDLDLIIKSFYRLKNLKVI